MNMLYVGRDVPHPYIDNGLSIGEYYKVQEDPHDKQKVIVMNDFSCYVEESKDAFIEVPAILREQVE